MQQSNSLHLHCIPKNETRVVLNILYSSKSIAIACDILMALVIKRVHNLPPHLGYVLTLRDIAQNRNTALTSWSRGSLTLRTVFLRASRRIQWQTRLRTCVKAKGRHFEHLLWSSHTTGSEPLHTHWSRFFSEPLTLLRGRQHNTSIFV